MSNGLKWVLGVVLLLLTGCNSLSNTQGTLDQLKPSTSNQRITVGQALKLLVAFSSAGSNEESLKFTTGKQREYLQGIIDLYNAGGHGKALPWRAESDSRVIIVEGDSSHEIVELTYINSFSMKEQHMRFRLEKSDNTWLIANHTDSTGTWWPDYLGK